MTHHERRNSPRAPLDTTIRYSLDESTWHQTRARNVSVGGILLSGASGMRIGQLTSLDFKLPNIRYQHQVLTRARVVRAVDFRGQDQGLALKFLKLNMSQYLLLEEFVARISGLPHHRAEKSLDPLEESAILNMERLTRTAAEQIMAQPGKARAAIDRQGPGRWHKHYQKLIWSAVIASGLVILYYVLSPLTGLF